MQTNVNPSSNWPRPNTTPPVTPDDFLPSESQTDTETQGRGRGWTRLWGRQPRRRRPLPTAEAAATRSTGGNKTLRHADAGSNSSAAKLPGEPGRRSPLQRLWTNCTEERQLNLLLGHVKNELNTEVRGKQENISRKKTPRRQPGGCRRGATS